jgi:hypothetical protein
MYVKMKWMLGFEGNECMDGWNNKISVWLNE